MSEEPKKNYRATFVLDSRHINETVDSAISKITETIEKNSGKVEKVENLGTQNFARTPDKGLTAGIYVQFDFSGAPTAPASIKEALRLEKVIDRTLIEAA